MTYKTDTNRNADYAEAIVKADLLQKGWIVLTPSSRDSPYDFVVDLGGRFVRLQVKKLNRQGTIHRIVARGNQKVTENGKVRNSIDYAKRGIEWLPMRQNPKGVKELDLRDNGGFIPPVGIKEKEDDIPAMLSNNEFVFTADAVRGMGDGDVELGAQRMYDQMKMLEEGGRV